MVTNQSSNLSLMNTFSTGKTQSMIVGQQKSELPGFKFSIQYFATFLLLILLSVSAGAQVITTGCLMDDFGTNAVLYTGTNFGGTNPPAGTVDWYKYTTGRNVIIQDAGTVTTLTNLLQGSSVMPTWILNSSGKMSLYINPPPRRINLLRADLTWATPPSHLLLTVRSPRWAT